MMRFVKGILFVTGFVLILNFFLCNMDERTLSYPVQFKFTIPYLLDLRSLPIPVGFMLLTSFFLGFVIAACFGLLQVFFRYAELRGKRKAVRQLEARVHELEAKLYAVDVKPETLPVSISSSVNTNSEGFL